MNTNVIDPVPSTLAEEAVGTVSAAPAAPPATDSLAPHWAEARQARALRLAEAKAKARLERESQAKEAERAKFAHD